ncbi:MAG: carbohydrate ABC transporter permease [Treponema sp.]|nr:carbohydrate ABC transporter permease [Treponema sp.]
MKKKVLGAVFRICRGLLVAGMCFMILQPVLVKLSSSFKSVEDARDSTVQNIPRRLSLENYVYVSRAISYPANFLRSLAVVIPGAILQIAACTLAAYGFARFRFPAQNLLFFLVIIIIVTPAQMIASPLYLNFRFFDVFGIFRLITGQPLNLLNKPISYYLVYATGLGLKGGLYIFIMRQYFLGAPKELEEAAWVDGCGSLRTFAQIMLPDAMPMITSCFLFSFVWQWADGYYVSLFMPRYGVLANTIGGLLGEVWNFLTVLNQNRLYTGFLMCIAPPLLVYLFAQRLFVASLSQTGIKA